MGDLAIPMGAWALLVVKDGLIDTDCIVLPVIQGQHQLRARPFILEIPG